MGRERSAVAAATDHARRSRVGSGTIARIGRQALVIAVVVAGLAACSSFGAAEDVAPSLSDGGTLDGDGDGGGVARADGETSCAPRPTACGTVAPIALALASEALPSEFDDLSQNGSVARIEDGRCGPGALRATTDVSGSGSATGAIARFFDGGFTRVRIAFAFRGPQAVADSFAHVGCIGMFRPSKGSQQRAGFRFRLDEGRLGIGATVRGPNDAEVATPPPIVLDEDVAAEAATWRTVDTTIAVQNGELVATGTFEAEPFGPMTAPLTFAVQNVEIACGIYYAPTETT